MTSEIFGVFCSAAPPHFCQCRDEPRRAHRMPRTPRSPGSSTARRIDCRDASALWKRQP